MRKLLFLSLVVLCAASLTGCNHCRNTCSSGYRGGMFGFGQSNYGGDCCCEYGGETMMGDGECCN